MENENVKDRTLKRQKAKSFPIEVFSTILTVDRCKTILCNHIPLATITIMGKRQGQSKSAICISRDSNGISQLTTYNTATF